MLRKVRNNALGLILSAVVVVAQLSIVTGSVRGMQAPAGAPSLGGTVINQDKEPVAGAMVLAENLTSGMKIPAKTDAKGVYRIPALPPGPFRVTVIMPGYANASVHTVLIASQVGSINFSLTPGCSATPGVPQAPAPPGQTPGAAIPVGPPGAASPESASQVTRNISVLGCKDLDHSKPASTVDELQDRSILNTAQTNSALQGPIIRGLDSSRVVTMIDGQRLNSTPVPIPATILGPSEVQAIRVSPGGNSVAAGSGALGGTLNLITEKARRTNTGHMLDLEIDGVIRSNGVNRSGAVSVFYSNSWMGLRLGGFLSRQRSYDAGGEAVSIDDVLKFGRFAATIGNSPSLYPIWSQPKDFTVQNGASHGSGESINLSIYASPKDLFDYTQLNVHTRDIESAFTGPPTSATDTFTEFVKLDKYSGRYDRLALTKWFQKLSIGFYWQKSTIPIAQNNYAIVPGSSFRVSPPGTDPFTGNPSQYKLGSFTENKFSVTAYSPNVGVTLAPLKGMVINAGTSYLHELTDDEFISRVFDPTIPVPGPFFPIPDFAYRNSAVFFQVDYNRIQWLHLSGGVRLDNWQSEAQLTSGTTVVSVSSTEGTRNFSAVFVNKHGISPFVRVEKAFREPSIGERVLRPITGGGNNPFEPESGVDVETGVKVQRKIRDMQVSGSAAFFHNHLYNFYAGDAPFRVPGQAANLVVDIERAATPAQPTPPPPPPNEVIIYGVDASFQWTIPVAHYGSVSAYGNMNWLHGRNKTPIPAQIALINAVYNRSDTPVRLEGSSDDVPQGLIVPFQGTFGGRYADARGRWNAQYDIRHSSQITRVNPLTLVNLPTTTVSYSTFRNLDSFTLHSVKASVTKSSEKYRMTFSFGIDNLANRLYWEHFAFAPAPGRSFTFGMALNFADLLGN